ncbi:hypothetical protein IWQ61_007270 [Dispira simplex]|nr:hypothetical protein IWQ61_007270 [Dispira simplex]
MDQLDELTQAVQRLYQEPAVQTGYLQLFHTKAAAELLALGYKNCCGTSNTKSEIPVGVRQHLCKSVIFENIRCTHTDYTNVTDSRYYCVIVQYVSSVNVNKLTEYVRTATNYIKGKKQYNFRLVDANTALALTGFGNNAICPVGLNTNLPMILDQAITQLEPSVFFLGGGHIDWKIALPVAKFQDLTRCAILDLSS